MLACQHSHARIRNNKETGIYIYIAHTKDGFPLSDMSMYACARMHTLVHTTGGREEGEGEGEEGETARNFK